VKLYPSRYIGRANGRHRAQPQLVPGAIADTRFVNCGKCGGVESAATVHGKVVLCAEGHQQVAGGGA
jgi:hypothetical protein